MKPVIALLFLSTLSSLAAADPSRDFDRGYALAEQKGCLECHAERFRLYVSIIFKKLIIWILI